MSDREQHIVDPTQNFYIDTKTPTNPRGRDSFEYVDLTESDDYKILLQAEKDRKLVDLFPRLDFRVASKASNLHTDEMLKDPKVLKYTSVGEGLIPIPKTAPADAHRLLKLLQSLDADTKMWQFSEALPELPAAKAKK